MDTRPRESRLGTRKRKVAGLALFWVGLSYAARPWSLHVRIFPPFKTSSLIYFSLEQALFGGELELRGSRSALLICSVDFKWKLNSKLLGITNLSGKSGLNFCWKFVPHFGEDSTTTLHPGMLPICSPDPAAWCQFPPYQSQTPELTMSISLPPPSSHSRTFLLYELKSPISFCKFLCRSYCSLPFRVSCLI